MGSNIKFLIQTRCLGIQRLSFESRLFLKRKVLLKEYLQKSQNVPLKLNGPIVMM